MDEKTARDMDRLLAGGKLSAPEAEAIFDRVIEEGERRKQVKRPRSKILYWAGPLVAAAAATFLVILLPGNPAGPPIPKPTLEEGALGPKPMLRVTCSGGALTACPVSSTLVFSLEGKGASGVLSAYAESIGHEGERVFYFSKEDGGAELSAPESGKHASERAVQLSDSLRPGSYRVHAVLADRPLAREELVGSASGGDSRATARVELVVIP